MKDEFAKLREALKSPFREFHGYMTFTNEYMAAADPATIAELLKERDALKAESAALKAEGEHLREKWKLFPDPTLPVLNANPPPKREP